MTSLYQAQYRNRLADTGIPALQSEDETPATFGEGVAAAFRYARDEGLTISEWRAWDPYYQERDAAYKELTGEDSAVTFWTQQEPWYAEAREMARTGEIAMDGDSLSLRSPRAKALAMNVAPVQLQSLAKREALHRLYPDRILSDEQIAEKVKADLKTRREANQRTIARADSGAAEFLGTAAGLVTDPLVLATLPFGPEWQGGKMLMNVLRGAGGEFVIGAGTEAVIQASVYDFKQSIDSPYTKAEAILNVLAAGAGGAFIRGAGSVAIDSAVALRRALATEGAARVLADAGVDPSLAARIADELVTREASRPAGIDPIAHSNAIDRAMTNLNEGRLAEVPTDPAVAGRLAEDAATRADAVAFLDARVADLLGTAGNRLPRGDRLALVGELKRAEFDVERASSEARLQELTDELKAEGATGRKAKSQATKRQAAEVAELQKEVDRLKKLVEADDAARAAEAEVSRIEQGKADPIETAKRYGWEDPQPLRNAIRDAVDAVRRSDEQPDRAAMNLAERVAEEPPPKPKVDKGAVPPALRAEAPKAEPRMEPAPRTEAVAAPEPEPPPPTPAAPVLRAVDELPDVEVAVAERADGSLDTKPVKEVLAELDDELRAIDQFEACVFKEAA